MLKFSAIYLKMSSIALGKITIKQCRAINVNLNKIGKSGNLENHATLKITKITKSRN